MQTREVPRDQWATFMNDLSAQMDQTTVTIESLSPDFGAQVAARDMPLVGLSLEEKGSDAGRIEIAAGDSAENTVTHVITMPTHVRLESTDEDVPVALQIEAEGEPTTLVHFRAALPPGTVDGTEHM